MNRKQKVKATSEISASELKRRAKILYEELRALRHEVDDLEVRRKACMEAMAGLQAKREEFLRKMKGKGVTAT